MSTQTTLSKSLLAIVLTSILGQTGCNSGGDGEALTTSNQDLNILVILTDDQRWDTLEAMPYTLDRIANEGVVFQNAYVTTPLCAPVRASILSGGHYARNTHVLSNELPNGSWSRFTETGTLAQQLRLAGFKTGFIGKYMNEFEPNYFGSGPFAPVGWDYFLVDRHAAVDIPSFYLTDFAEQGQGVQPPGYRRGVTSQYETEFATDAALSFIDRNLNNPFFLMLSYHAPHVPATDDNQLPQDLNLFQDYIYRGRAWGEADMSDKSDLVFARQSPNFIQSGKDDYLAPGQLRLLQPVDRGINKIVDRLSELNLLDKTVIIFLSDNGYQWGEHNLRRKSHAFDESIRVPLIVKMPGMPAGSRERLIAANLDIPATIQDIAGLPISGDGTSLLNTLESGEDLESDSQVFLEHYAENGDRTYVWTGTVKKTAKEFWKLVDYQNGQSEFYDLVADPFELENQIDNPAYQSIAQSMSQQLSDFKRIAILDLSLSAATANIPYTHQLQWWGTLATPKFTIAEGSLPAGITLSTTGLLSGTTPEPGDYPVTITATSNEKSAYDGLELSHSLRLTLSVGQ